MPVATTHELTWDATTVTKRYSRWDRGEPRREWDALTLIHPRLPDLVPQPLDCDLSGVAPFVTMSRLPGDPVSGGGAVPSRCLDAVADAVTAFHHALSPEALADRPVRRWDAATGMTEVQDWALQEQGRRSTDEGEESVRTALADGAGWITRASTSLSGPPADPVFGRADGNAANLIWDGERVRLVDFEDAGVSDVAYEVADLVEHVSVWSDAAIDSDALLGRFDLSAVAGARVQQYRRMFALFWLLMLLPGNPAHRRNPKGTVEGQANRLLGLL